MVKTTKVLITGISGLLGSTYARYLITNGGYEVIGIDNMIGGVEGNVPEEDPSLFPEREIIFQYGVGGADKKNSTKRFCVFRF